MRLTFIIILVSFLLTACGVAPGIVSPTSGERFESSSLEPDQADAPTTTGSSTIEQSIDGENPLTNALVPSTGEYSFNQLLPFDGIRPVYDPDFATPDDVDSLLRDDELVLGMNLGDEAKAYPISVLRFREMVNDEIAGIPTLVTW